MFIPFIGPGKEQIARRLMGGMSGVGLKMTIGVTAAGFERHRTLRLCAECAQRDISIEGVAYWHLIHQASGIVVCPIHGCALSGVVESALEKLHDSLCFPLDERVQQHAVPYSLTSFQAQRMLNLARLIDWGFSNPKLASLLLERNYLASRIETMCFLRSGRFALRDLQNFLAHSLSTYPQLVEFERLVGQGAVCPAWPISLIRKRLRVHHPLYHFCLLELLGVTCEDCELFLREEGSYLRPAPIARGTAVGSSALDQECLARRTSFSDQALLSGARNASDYMWLYRHDRQWLTEYCSIHRLHTPGPTRVDTVERYTLLAARIDKAAAAIVAAPGKPIKITIASLSRELGVSEATFDNRGRHPQCGAALKRWIESRHAFQLRKVAWAARELTLRYRGIGKSSLLRKAGINVCVLSDEELAMYID
ncbi:TnsD family Tn7-like transposition protein [Pseudomonas sp. NPDC086251]|uniref:TnsD family Tn7-like transposition protein n=1 Tax=Pseudomonas sp. NPDC086251 TaxID=3364431 RepID=UPI0038372628